MPQLFAMSLSSNLSGVSFPEITERYTITYFKTGASSDLPLKEKMEKNANIKKLYTKFKNIFC